MKKLVLLKLAVIFLICGCQTNAESDYELNQRSGLSVGVDKETNKFIQDFYNNMCKVPITTYKLKFCEAYFGKLENYPVFFSYNNRSHELYIFKENCIDRLITDAFTGIVNLYPCAADSSEYESYGPGGCGCEVCIDEALQAHISTKYSNIEKIIIPEYDTKYSLYHIIKLIKKDYLCSVL